MKQSLFLLPVLAALSLAPCAEAATIDNSTITQVVKDVTILQPGGKARHAAQINATFGVPDIMKTGPDSRAEMIAPDQTVTRVGANTLFSFEPQKREINLQKGSILFNSPTGKGGGTIKTAAATASVLGTTLIVATTPNGGFKVLLMEGTGQVRTAKGRIRTLKAGQMVFALPGGDLSGVLTFQLSQQVGVSQLVQGYRKPLPSLAKIQAAIAVQDRMIARGQLVTTNLLAGEDPTTAYKVDVNSREVLIENSSRGGGISGALGSDAIIAKPGLEQKRVFTLNLTIATAVGAESILLPPDFAVFYARNTTIVTPSIDLSPYNPGVFVFVSLEDFIVNQGVSLVGGPGIELYFIAGNTIQQKPGTFISADTASLNVYALGFGGTFSGSGSSGGGLVWSDFSLTNTGSVFVSAPSVDLFNTDIISRTSDLTVDTTGDFLVGSSQASSGTQAFYVVGAAGDTNFSAGGNFVGRNIDIVGDYIDIQASQDITLTNSSLNRFGTFPGYTGKGGSGSLTSSAINVDASGALTLTNSFLEANSISLSSSTLNINGSELKTTSDLSVSTSGNITVGSGVFRSFSTNITGGSAVAINSADFHPSILDSPGANSSVSITAQNILGVNGTNFNVTDVSLAAQTIVLRNVNFQAGSRVVLDSASGRLAPNPNTGRPVSFGDVNFIQNVRHGSIPAEQAVTGGSIIIR